MFTPIGFFQSAGGFIPSFSPFAYYDALNPDSYDATNKTWSDLALVNTTDDSTWDTAVQNAVLPTHNENGYWEIQEQGSDQGFTYGNGGTTTNPFSLIANDVHTIFTYVRIDAYDGNSCDVIGNATSAGSILLGAYDIGGSFGNNFARAHVWATGVQFTDSPTDSVVLDTWMIIGQRYTDVGSGQRRLDVFTCDYDGTVAITQGSNFTPGSITSTAQELRTGRNTEVRGNYDWAGYALYKDDLSNSDIQTVCDELSDRFGEPT